MRCSFELDPCRSVNTKKEGLFLANRCGQTFQSDRCEVCKQVARADEKKMLASTSWQVRTARSRLRCRYMDLKNLATFDLIVLVFRVACARTSGPPTHTAF